MTNVSKSQEKQIKRIEFRSVKTFRYAVVTVGFIGQTFEVEVCQSDIRDFVLCDLSRYEGWLNDNYQNWKEDSEEEVAEELAAQVWKEDWMIIDFVNSLAIWDMNSVEKISIDKNQADLFIMQILTRIEVEQAFRNNDATLSNMNEILTSAKKLFYQQL